MKINLTMQVSRDNPCFTYQPSTSTLSTILPDYPLDNYKMAKIATDCIPDSYNIELARQTDEISRLIDERREYLATVREELQPQLQSILDQYITDHPEELL